MASNRSSRTNRRGNRGLVMYVLLEIKRRFESRIAKKLHALKKYVLKFGARSRSWGWVDAPMDVWDNG